MIIFKMRQHLYEAMSELIFTEYFLSICNIRESKTANIFKAICEFLLDVASILTYVKVGFQLMRNSSTK